MPISIWLLPGSYKGGKELNRDRVECEERAFVEGRCNYRVSFRGGLLGTRSPALCLRRVGMAAAVQTT